MMTKRIFAFFTLFLMCFLLAATEVRADLTITPWRVVFGAHDRSAVVQLINISDRTNTYRMGWTLLKAEPDGKYRYVPATKDSDKDPHSVENMVIFTPRQVTIEPHGVQVIRLSLRRPADLPPGEYRAHMTLTRMAKAERPEQDPNAKSMDLSMNVNLSFSIPIIVRQGEDKDLKVALTHPQLKQEGKASGLRLDLTRVAGKFSSYGTIRAFWTPPKGSEEMIGEMTNIALYPELKTRHIEVPIMTKYNNIAGGKIRVVYEGKYESEGKTWDEETFPVGGGK
jgi:fimbrial chaperone protein